MNTVQIKLQIPYEIALEITMQQRLSILLKRTQCMAVPVDHLITKTDNNEETEE